MPLLILLGSLLPASLLALTTVQQTISTAPPPAANDPAAVSSAPSSRGPLEALVAPIALYPDALLSQIFMASTYPLQIVEADRWVKANPGLAGDAAAKALEAQPWDPSIKSLVNFPQVLDMMSTQLDWTQKLGDAFVTQQKATMDAVQALRAKAKAQGNLESNAQQTVTQQPGSQTIVIQPAQPDVIYVPTCNPAIVYGAWPYPAYPPVAWYPPGSAATAAISFGVGVACGFAWGYAWGHCDWNHGDINVNVNHNQQFNPNINRQNYINNYQNNISNSGNRRNDFSGGQGTWQHDPGGRGGVPYGNGQAAGQFGGSTQQQAEQARQAFRGKAEQGRQALDRGAAEDYRGLDAASGAFGGAGANGAFDDMGRGGDAARAASDRGWQSQGGDFGQSRGFSSAGVRRGGNDRGFSGGMRGGGAGGFRGGGFGGGRGGRR